MTAATTYIYITQGDVRVSPTPITTDNTQKFLYCTVISSGAGSGIGKVTILYSYGTSPTDNVNVEFNNANPVTLIDHEGDTLVDKLKSMFISLDQQTIDTITSTTIFLGDTDFEKYVGLFVGGYGLLLSTYFLMSHDHVSICEPFGHIVPCFPEVDMSIQSLMTQSLYSYIDYFRRVIEVVSGDLIGKEIIKWGNIFWTNWGTYFPQGEAHDNSEALHCSLTGLTRYNNDKSSALHEKIMSTMSMINSCKREICVLTEKSLDKIEGAKCCFVAKANEMFGELDKRDRDMEKNYGESYCKIKETIECEKEHIRDFADATTAVLDSKTSESLSSIEDYKTNSIEELCELRESTKSAVDDVVNDAKSSIEEITNKCKQDMGECRDCIMLETKDKCSEETKKLERKRELTNRDLTAKCSSAIREIDDITDINKAKLDSKCSDGLEEISKLGTSNVDLITSLSNKGTEDITSLCDKYTSHFDSLYKEHRECLEALKDGIHDHAESNSKSITDKTLKMLDCIKHEKEELIKDISNEVSIRTKDRMYKHIKSRVDRELDAVKVRHATNGKSRSNSNSNGQNGKAKTDVIIDKLLAEVHLLKVEITQLKHGKYNK